MTLPSPTCVIPRGFHRYHVEISVVSTHYGPSKSYDRWRRANPSPLPHYEAEVWRGSVYEPTGFCKRRGDLCWGYGFGNSLGNSFGDTYGRTPAEAVQKARRIAREWVRWQLGLGRFA